MLARLTTPQEMIVFPLLETAASLRVAKTKFHGQIMVSARVSSSARVGSCVPIRVERFPSRRASSAAVGAVFSPVGLPFSSAHPGRWYYIIIKRART